MSEKAIKKSRVDGQVTGLAGELFVAAELLKRGLQTSVTFGNAKAIDLLAYNPLTRRKFTVQVKALRQTNYFLIGPASCSSDHIYVFVLLNKPGQPVKYFIVPGSVLASEPERFGKGFKIQSYQVFIQSLWQNSLTLGNTSKLPNGSLLSQFT